MFLLVFALLIQNTCPHGFAGKTGLASTCGHCPLKKCFAATPPGQNDIVSHSPSAHFPLFVFALPKTVHTFHLQPISFSRPILADSYRNALPDELLRLPRA
jgi:hypothetical protein